MLKNLFRKLKSNKNIVYYVIIAVLVYLIYTEWSQKEGFLAPAPAPGALTFSTTTRVPTTRVPTTRVPTTRVPTFKPSTTTRVPTTTMLKQNIPAPPSASISGASTFKPITRVPTTPRASTFKPSTTTRVPTTPGVQGDSSNSCIEKDWGGKCPNEIKSSNGKYKTVMQKDGNLVLYKKLWDSNTMGKGKKPYRHIMQKDGNYVVYDADNQPMWASGTDGKGKGPYKLIMQDDGNLVVYKDNAVEQNANYAIWSTGTDK